MKIWQKFYILMSTYQRIAVAIVVSIVIALLAIAYTSDIYKKFEVAVVGAENRTVTNPLVYIQAYRDVVHTDWIGNSQTNISVSFKVLIMPITMELEGKEPTLYKEWAFYLTGIPP